jgi:restriction system protein
MNRDEMARRKNDGLVDVFMELPWSASVIAGFIAFVVMYWIVPSSLASNRFFSGFASLSRSFAWLTLLLFGITGLVAYVRSWVVDRNQTSRAVERGSSLRTREPSLGMPFAGKHKQSEHPTLTAGGWGASNQRSVAPAAADKASEAWTIDALRSLEWKRFELLCAKYYEAVGFKSETIRCGADGGIDVKLFKIDPNKPLAVVQCKSWNTQQVGVKEVRELLGVMTHEKVRRGVFITTSTYTKDARSLSADNPIQLLDGEGFVKKLCELPRASQDDLLKFAFEGDYKTPTCASCGIKMAKRESKRGAFWGCFNYPRCRSTFAIRQAA